MGEEGEQEAVVPSGPLSFALDRCLFGMLPHDVEGELADESEVLRAVIGAASSGIFTKGDIEHPMELVFDGPVGPRDLEHALRGQDRREQEVADDHRLWSIGALAAGLHASHRGQSGGVAIVDRDDDRERAAPEGDLLTTA